MTLLRPASSLVYRTHSHFYPNRGDSSCLLETPGLHNQKQNDSDVYRTAQHEQFVISLLERREKIIVALRRAK